MGAALCRNRKKNMYGSNPKYTPKQCLNRLEVSQNKVYFQAQYLKKKRLRIIWSTYHIECLSVQICVIDKGPG